MFNSTILDVACGLVFIFLAVSLATGAVVEAINSALKLRSKTLMKGVGDLVNDPAFNGLALKLYRHALISPRGSGTATDAAGAKQLAPAYIDPKQFATALVEILGLAEAGPNGGTPDRAAVPRLLAALQSSPLAADPQMRQLVGGIIRRAQGDLDEVRQELANWFDSAMDRVSGAFKRWTQLASVLVAFGLCIVTNIDSIEVARALWTQPKLAQQLGLSPEMTKLLTAAPADSADNAPGTIPMSREEAAQALALLTTLDKNLPVGWPDGHLFYMQDKAGVGFHGFWADEARWRRLGGWVIAALATLFGAPFWFDLLQNVTRLKGSGPSPQEKANGAAASA